MVEIHTLSVADFKHTIRNNDLYDSNIEQRTDIAVISIGNSFEDGDPDDILSCTLLIRGLHVICSASNPHGNSQGIR